MPQVPSSDAAAPQPTAPALSIAAQQYSPPVPFAGTPQTSGKAIGSLICGIINIFPLSVVAIILGHLSLSEIKKNAGRLTGQGLAIAGLVLGYLGVIAIPFILIVAAIAIPNLLRARMAANESSAAGRSAIFSTQSPRTIRRMPPSAIHVSCRPSLLQD